MSVGIDIRVLSRGSRTGVEEYTLGLLSSLLSFDRETDYRLFYNAFYKKDLNYRWLNLDNVGLQDYRIPNRVLFLATRYFNYPKLDKLLETKLDRCEVYFNPHFFPFPLSRSCKKVITFHDLSFVRYPEFFSFKKRWWHRLLINARTEAQAADRIIAVSESTKRDLINLYSVSSEKIRVIYPGAGVQFKKMDSKDINVVKIRKKYNLPEKFILYFGTLEPRKNLIGLIGAFEKIKKDVGGRKLVIAGAKGWLYEEILKKAQKSVCKKDIIFTGFIDQSDKPYLYNLADIFVYPSFFEGFGFPVLEAMACGLPVITSNSSSLPEVGAESVIMINPYNIDEMAWAIKETVGSVGLKEKLSSLGQKRAEKFSWRKSAEETLGVIKECIV